jgi:hypothetical protein
MELVPHPNRANPASQVDISGKMMAGIWILNLRRVRRFWIGGPVCPISFKKADEMKFRGVHV